MPHLVTLLIQVSVILVVARLVGIIFRRIHQPQVMGEMVAGILLGPSFLGWIAPNISAALFPPESLGFLSALSQIGLVLFMFLIGLELDPRTLRGRGHTVVTISHASIVAPFFLGVILALYLYTHLSDDSVTFTQFALFLGAAMSITAFPVLARILNERKLLQTKLGSMAIACAAIDDITGWCILAGVVFLVRASSVTTPLWLTFLGVACYVALMLFVVRRLAGALEGVYRKRGAITQDVLAVIFLLVLLSALATEWLGIHAFFGAFFIGAVMPKHHDFVRALTEKLEDVAVVLFLPIFFAFVGLRTSIGLVNGAEMWFYCILIILTATVGKFGGSALVSRLSGVPMRESVSLGILMNTRGLMELLILNIGLEIGVLSPALFTMMVLMALVTTFMTAPALQWVYYRKVWPEEPALVTGADQDTHRTDLIGDYPV
jgi:Kef-type K+ transport system membrane component KefB